jgi:hypothetical protein
MVFPTLVVLVGLFALIAYFARNKVTYTVQKGTYGSIGTAFIVFIIAAMVGFGLDWYLSWSTIPTYMYAVGGALQAMAIVFWAGLALLCLSMLLSAKRCGVMVA